MIYDKLIVQTNYQFGLIHKFQVLDSSKMNESVCMENESETESASSTITEEEVNLKESITDQDQNDIKMIEEEEEEDQQTAAIDILPDEILEHVFSHLLPYEDLDHVKCVSQRWNRVVKKVIVNLGNAFEKSFRDGSLKCETISTVYDDSHHVVGSWISERFGHMCCYYDRAMYVVGGTTHSPTTFNDMWMFDLNLRSWTRVLASGKFPTPKALASFVQYKDKFVLFGGIQPAPRMQPIKIFDELHIYEIATKRWSQVITSQNPNPSAGHSATIHRDIMVVFGGRSFNQKEPSYPISNSTWLFNFIDGEWYEISTNEPPPPRYGQTQVVIDDSHALIVGGCGGPNQIFSDVWLLKIESSNRNGYTGTWTKMKLRNPKNEVPHHDFHHSGCKVGSAVVFCQRQSSLSPYLAFLHFDSWRPPPQGHPTTQLQHNGNLVFEANSRSRSYFHSRCSSGLRQQTTATMLIYSLDISKVLIDGTVEWSKEPDPPTQGRPRERMLYTMIKGRAELILFGGFFRSDSSSCRVSNDVFLLRKTLKTY